MKESEESGIVNMVAKEKKQTAVTWYEYFGVNQVSNIEEEHLFAYENSRRCWYTTEGKNAEREASNSLQLRRKKCLLINQFMVQ